MTMFNFLAPQNTIENDSEGMVSMAFSYPSGYLFPYIEVGIKGYFPGWLLTDLLPVAQTGQKPAYGCVTPQSVITGIPNMAAKYHCHYPWIA